MKVFSVDDNMRRTSVGVLDLAGADKPRIYDVAEFSHDDEIAESDGPPVSLLRARAQSLDVGRVIAAIDIADGPEIARTRPG